MLLSSASRCWVLISLNLRKWRPSWPKAWTVAMPEIFSWRYAFILARMNAYLQENISGMATVQAFGQEGRHFRKFKEINTQHRDALLKSIHYNALFFPSIE